MFAFISYPREFEEFAVALEAELASRDIDRFLDREDIKPGEVWRRRIDSSIAKADVFVILYSKKADSKERVFHTELERIEQACRQSGPKWLPSWLNISKKWIITVIFPQTPAEEVPVFFSTRHLVLTDVAGNTQDRRNAYWINQIAQRIEEIGHGQIFTWRKIIARTALALGVGVIAVLSSYIYDLKERIAGNGQALCHSLIGEYGLHQNYVFVVGPDVRSLATGGTWKASGCRYDEKIHAYVLDGKEVTYFDVEMNISNRYERIARAKYDYSSTVLIGKDGTLIGRSIDPVLVPAKKEFFRKGREGRDLKLTQEAKEEKFEEITELRNHRHQILKTNPCSPTIGKSNGMTIVAFVCEDYTRVMVKTS